MSRPWRQHLVDETRVIDERGEDVARAWGDYSTDAVRMEANARLIAAAPELLEALQSIAELYADETACGAIARAAIAKAEGHS